MCYTKNLELQAVARNLEVQVEASSILREKRTTNQLSALIWACFRGWSRPYQNHCKLDQIPGNLQGSGGIEIRSVGPGYRAPLLWPIGPLADYSIAMWLKLPGYFKSITISMRSNDFSLEFIIHRWRIQARCSHMRTLGARACTRLLYGRWIYIVLTNRVSSSNFVFWINGDKYPLDPIQGPLSKNEMETSLVEEDFDGYVRLRYKDRHENIKFFSTVDVADVQVLPFMMTQHEIRAIVEQSTSINNLDMARYTLEHWANRRWYSGYLSRQCILLYSPCFLCTYVVDFSLDSSLKTNTSSLLFPWSGTAVCFTKREFYQKMVEFDIHPSQTKRFLTISKQMHNDVLTMIFCCTVDGKSITSHFLVHDETFYGCVFDESYPVL